jgi:hypothetical protein
LGFQLGGGVDLLGDEGCFRGMSGVSLDRTGDLWGLAEWRMSGARLFMEIELDGREV